MQAIIKLVQSCADCCDPYIDYKSYAKTYESYIHQLVKDTSDLSLVVKGTADHKNDLLSLKLLIIY